MNLETPRASPSASSRGGRGGRTVKEDGGRDAADNDRRGACASRRLRSPTRLVPPARAKPGARPPGRTPGAEHPEPSRGSDPAFAGSMWSHDDRIATRVDAGSGPRTCGRTPSVSEYASARRLGLATRCSSRIANGRSSKLPLSRRSSLRSRGRVGIRCGAARRREPAYGFLEPPCSPRAKECSWSSCSASGSSGKSPAPDGPAAAGADGLAVAWHRSPPAYGAHPREEMP